MDKFEAMQKFIEELKADAEKFYVKENSAAGTRFRKGLQTLKKMASELRTDVATIREARKSVK